MQRSGFVLLVNRSVVRAGDGPGLAFSRREEAVSQRSDGVDAGRDVEDRLPFGRFLILDDPSGDDGNDDAR